jgi:hypothetical protein
MLDKIGWYDAASIAGDEGDFISLWDDEWGGLALGTAFTGQRPTLQVDSGVPIVRFDGVAQRLHLFDGAATTTYPVAIAQPYTIAAVCKMRSVKATIQNLMGSSGANNVQIYVNGSAKWVMLSSTGLTSTHTDTNDWTVVVATFNNTSSDIRVGGVSYTGTAGAVTLDGLRVGCNTAQNQFAYLDLAEILVVGHAVTGTERTKLEAYLTAKRDILAGA